MNVEVLVTTVSYSDKGFIHPRNMSYKDAGITVTVLEFRAHEDYNIDGIRIISLKTYEREKKRYDTLILHAPNIRNHYLFMRKYGEKFKNFIFFFHGHEVLMKSKVYSRPYDYMKGNFFETYISNAYDSLKLKLWRDFFAETYYKSNFVFVSNWMKAEFLKWTQTNITIVEGRDHIIYNCIGKEFESATYDFNIPKKYDFITIRDNLDGSKYCIDLINRLAYEYPEMSFLIVGKGEYFSHYKKANNIQRIEARLKKEEIIPLLQQSRCALMPTRTDAQGVMMCEMASIGMPLLTSDISVCHEVFEGFDNVRFFSLDLNSCKLHDLLCEIERGLPYKENLKYYQINTCAKEIELIKSL